MSEYETYKIVNTINVKAYSLEEAGKIADSIVEKVEDRFHLFEASVDLYDVRVEK